MLVKRLSWLVLPLALDLAQRLWTIAFYGCMTETASTLSRLGVALYRNRAVLGQHAVPVLGGLCVAWAASIMVTLLSAGWSDLALAFAAGTAARPSTAALANEIARVIVSEPVLLSGFVFVAGMFGAIFGAFLLTSTQKSEPSSRGPFQGLTRYGFMAAQVTGKLRPQAAVASMMVHRAGRLTRVARLPF